MTTCVTGTNLSKPISVFSRDELEQKVADLFVDNGVCISLINRGPNLVPDWSGACSKLATKLCAKHAPWLSLAVSDASAWDIVVAVARNYEIGFRLQSESTKSGAKRKQINHPSLIYLAIAEMSRVLCELKRGSAPPREGIVPPIVHGFKEGAIRLLDALSTEVSGLDLEPDSNSNLTTRLKVEALLKKLPNGKSTGAGVFVDWDQIDHEVQVNRLTDLAEKLSAHRGLLERFFNAFPKGAGDLKQAIKEIEKREKTNKSEFHHEVLAEDGHLAALVEGFLKSLKDDSKRIDQISIRARAGLRGIARRREAEQRTARIAH